MSSPQARTDRYDPSRHDTSRFESGNDALDRWLSRYAGQSQRRDAARTFVVADGRQVLGYYAMLAGELDHDQATASTRKGMSRHYPIPVAIVARLAVDRRHHRQGLGAVLLRDALQRAATASEQLAVRAVVVHAIDDQAASFYQHFGFRALGSTPRTLMVTLAEIRAAGYP